MANKLAGLIDQTGVNSGTGRDSLPGLMSGSTKVKTAEQVRVRFKRLNMCDAADIMELEDIETKNLRGEKIAIISRERFLFMDQIIVLISYLEETTP